MAKVGRNELCPCGSGKKYKKCCEGRANAGPTPSPLGQGYRFVEDDVDLLSNSVLQLIRDGKLDEAMHACQRLRTEYPEVVDGLERTAMVHEARGDLEQAVEFYRRALSFAQHPDQQDGFDEGFRDYYRGKVAELEARSRPTS